jgi:type VI secretion system protein ImpG
MLDTLRPLYERELTHLRQLSKEFAAQYPKIAGRLLMQGERCEDPHVERLIQAFAFAAARIHHKLDDDLPEITDALLNVVYPHYLRPIPSTCIVQFDVDPEQTQLTSRYTVARHTPLLTRPVKGMPCRFRTCYPVELWPLKVADASLEAIERSPFAVDSDAGVACLRIRVACAHGLKFSALGVDRLRFFLDGESPLTHALYELLMNNAARVIVKAGTQTSAKQITLPGGSLQPVGFADDEGLLDYDARSFLGYRLLHEYFTFPEKFLFFDVVNLDRAASLGSAEEIEICVLLSEFERMDRLPRLAQTTTRNTFRLGCTPAVNLFKQLAEPIRLTHERSEYHILPDVRRQGAMEVYSVDSVRRLVQADDGDRLTDIAQFYSLKHATEEDAGKAFWYAARRPSPRRDDAGTEMYLCLVDLAFNPVEPAAETVSIALTCTNRDLPAQLPFGGQDSDFEAEGAAAASRIRCLRKPTATIRPPMRKGAQWRLISHLALNHLSIVDSGREALLEILNLYNFADSPALRKEIGGLTGVHSEQSTMRVGSAQRMAFVRGTDVKLEFDEDQYVGSGVYLFASVLERFLALYCNLNSFVRVSVNSKQRERTLASWPPRAGVAILV